MYVQTDKANPYAAPSKLWIIVSNIIECTSCLLDTSIA